MENFKLSEDLEGQKLNLKDITEFLTAELKARTLSSTALEEKAAELQAALDEQRTHFEEMVARLRAERDSEMARVRVVFVCVCVQFSRPPPDLFSSILAPRIGGGGGGSTHTRSKPRTTRRK